MKAPTLNFIVIQKHFHGRAWRCGTLKKGFHLMEKNQGHRIPGSMHRPYDKQKQPKKGRVYQMRSFNKNNCGANILYTGGNGIAGRTESKQDISQTGEEICNAQRNGSAEILSRDGIGIVLHGKGFFFREGIIANINQMEWSAEIPSGNHGIGH